MKHFFLIGSTVGASVNGEELIAKIRRLFISDRELNGFEVSQSRSILRRQIDANNFDSCLCGVPD
ncbi:hypothetical protein A5738_09980 [Mycobacterium colombiense]|nr:hypothetical protein A5738_09980 [Mycobacterium colombiense]